MTQQPGPLCTPANETWKAINAVHYVNISPTVEEELRPRLKEIKTSIERFTMWASGEAEQTIKAKIKEGDFEGEIGSLERNTAIQRCRASAHEEVLRTRTVCLTHTINFSHSKKFNSKTPSVPENILSSALQGFPMPPGYKGTLEGYKGTLEEELRKSIADIIGMAGGGRVRHSVLAAVLVHDRVADTIDPKLRLITFEMDPVVIEPEPVGWFRSWFSKPEQSIQMDMKFEGSEWDFSTAIWDEVYKSIHPTLIEKGKELAKMAAAVSTSN